MARKKPQVVIIGGGFAGRRVCTLLAPMCHVTLLDAQGFAEYTPGILRCLVEPAAISRMLVPNAGTVHAVAEGVELNPDGQGGQVLCTDGRRVSFGFLVLCTGSAYVPPIKPQPPPAAGYSPPSGPQPSSLMASPESALRARKEELAAAARLLARATSVLVVGGGTVGVELAAEIAGHYCGARRKRVTLICSADRLLDRMPASASAYAERWLRARGVEILLSMRVAQWPDQGVSTQGPQMVVTSSGTSITADLVYRCTGCTPLGAHLYGSVATQMQGTASDSPVPQGSRGPCGVPVNAHLQAAGCFLALPCQVPGCKFIYACGDAAQAPAEAEKTAYTADVMASIVAQNILRVQRWVQQGGKIAADEPLLRFPQDLPRLVATKRAPVVTAVSLYKYDGIMQLNSLVLTGWVAAINKAAIELFQLQVMRGSWLWTAVWLLLETLTTMIGSLL